MTMEVAKLEVSREAARALWQKYQTHRNYQTPDPIDAEIERIYKIIAKGGLVIRALESIVKAGLGSDGLPKLAIARADAQKCHLQIGVGSGNASMGDAQSHRGNASRDRRFLFANGSFEFPRSVSGRWNISAIVPHIPPDIRPARGLANYHILWEAVWTKEVPIDPMLLRRIGKGDTWLVVGAWDLTPVERAVLTDRLRLN